MKIGNKRAEAVVFFQVFIWWVIIIADGDARLEKNWPGLRSPSFALYRRMISRWVSMSLAVTSRICMKKKVRYRVNRKLPRSIPYT